MQSIKFEWIFGWLLLACLTCVSLLLIIELYDLHHQVKKLHTIKNEYKCYIEALRKEMYFDFEEKPEETSLTLINRQSDYLRDSAISFARAHQLDQAIKTMYSLEEQSPLHSSSSLSKKLAKVPLLSRFLAPHKSKRFKTKDFSGQWPLTQSSFWISSKFGPRRKRNGAWGFHFGIDMAALTGTPVYAIAEGEVIETSYSPRGYGKYIVIRHTKKYTSRYAHLDTMYVKKGQKVTEGMLIGRVGSTGAVRGKNASHLHFEVQLFGKRINPLYILNKLL